MLEKEAKTDYIEKEIREVISEIKDAVREGKSGLFHEADLLEHRPPQGGMELLA